MNIEERIKQINNRLLEIDNEKAELLNELNTLRLNNINTNDNIISSYSIESPEEKINIFISLFRCRKDVYPKYWENKNKKGYSPVCINEWKYGLCNKPKIKCGECNNRDFALFDEKVAREHLEGKVVIGTYTITTDDKCIFLAADFDKDSWQSDVIEYKEAAKKLGIEVYIEISRSGNGAHAWIFFSESIRARLARRLGTIILLKASENRYEISLESYDRFFPNQDTCPSAGFGNLIALPLQNKIRNLGRTVFVDNNFNQIEDQWEYLNKCRRFSNREVEIIVENNTTDFNNNETEIEIDDLEIEQETISTLNEDINNCYTKEIEIALKNDLRINIENLPSKLITALKRTATFANPKFFELQKMRFSTWNTPRYIFCGKLKKEFLFLPRGNYEDIKDICTNAGAEIKLFDKRLTCEKTNILFSGELNNEQEYAVKEILQHDFGVLVSPTGSGKTVMSCYIIAKRKASTLILVHRSQLIEQWKEQLTTFLNINEKEIGVLGSGRKKLKGTVDLAMIQTLSKKKENISEIISRYEQVIVDECHHIPAVSFEEVLNKFQVRYCLGLTATPYRKDGHQAIIFMQCGPIRFEMQEYLSNLSKKVLIKETNFKLPDNKDIQIPIHEVWDYIVNDKDRLNQISKDILDVLSKKRFPLILSERKEHLELIQETVLQLDAKSKFKGFIFTGDMRKTKRKKQLEEIDNLISNFEPFYILSTGSLIGEGFNLPELDTLFLTMPISFKGRLIQYAGRIHREHINKKEVLIYDYVDTSSGLTISMFKKRLSTYKRIGYEIIVEQNSKANRWI